MNWPRKPPLTFTGLFCNKKECTRRFYMCSINCAVAYALNRFARLCWFSVHDSDTLDQPNKYRSTSVCCSRGWILKGVTAIVLCFLDLRFAWLRLLQYSWCGACKSQFAALTIGLSHFGCVSSQIFRVDSLSQAANAFLCGILTCSDDCNANTETCSRVFYRIKLPALQTDLKIRIDGISGFNNLSFFDRKYTVSL